MSIPLVEHPDWLLERMNVAENVYSAMSLYRSTPPGQEAEFAKQYPDAWKIYQVARNVING